MRRLSICAAAAVAVTLGARPAIPAELMPLDQVHPGLVGVGRTVFEGSRVEEFKVTILGVLENVVGPNGSLILARLEGGPLEKTGVIAGMSGSPVFIGGKLVGAVSYGFPFSKETIAGITPIGEMIAATNTEAPRAASARLFAPFSVAASQKALDPGSLLAILKGPRSLNPEGTLALGAPLPPHLAGMPLARLALPLVFSGFEPDSFEWARGLFTGLGFTPVLGGGRGSLPKETLPDLTPGSAVGISLIEGDLDVSVTGTVTDIDKDRVYAFGHPFYNLGPTQFPMKKAYVYSVFPSLYQSWKISATGDPVGTMDQDRTTAVAGRLGRTPRMIPVNVRITTSRGRDRSYDFRIVEDELFSPLLAYVSLVSVLQANERAFGTSTLRVDARLSLSGRPEIGVEDFFTQDQPALQAATLVAAPVAYVMSNDFEHVTVDKIKVDVSSFETTQRATLERAWLQRTGPIRAGTTVPLKLLLRTYRGEEATETIPVSIPQNARSGAYSLLVADSASLTNLEQRELRHPFVPRNIDQLIRAINGLRKNNHIYARLLRSDDGAIVSGEYFQSLPPSKLSVLGTGDQGSLVVPIRTSAVWDFDLPTEFVFSGSRSLSLTVEQ